MFPYMLQEQKLNIDEKSIATQTLPRHVAIIMDGNGRWAQKKNRARIWGHKKGVDSVREVVRTSGELGIEVLSLYAFSDENWGRPTDEVTGIMSLLNQFVVSEKKELNKNNVKLRTMGEISRLPTKTQFLIRDCEEYLSDNTGLTLNIALSYGAKSELSHACRLIAEKVKEGCINLEDINPETIEKELWTKSLPPVDLLIRTSGEQRISNFMLWQIAYSELYFTPVHWPDFKKQEYLQAIADFQNRKRRFGLTDAQVKAL